MNTKQLKEHAEKAIGQIESLDQRLGKNKGASKERTKLNRHIEAYAAVCPQEKVKKPVAKKVAAKKVAAKKVAAKTVKSKAAK